MNSRLKTMVAVVGVVTLGGISFLLYVPEPATIKMIELRDAGIREGQEFVLVCPERITARTRRRIDAVQPGFLRPHQRYARVARVAECYPKDGGALCWTVSTWAPKVGRLDAEIIVPSLRLNLIGLEDAGWVEEDGGENENVDDSLHYSANCRSERCSTYDAGGIFPNAACGNLNRVWAETPPCVLPMCWTDGGWDDEAGEPGHIPAPNCQAIGDRGLEDGGPRWAGCNVLPTQFSSGTECLPVECSVVVGDDPPEVLGGL